MVFEAGKYVHSISAHKTTKNYVLAEMNSQKKKKTINNFFLFVRLPVRLDEIFLRSIPKNNMWSKATFESGSTNDSLCVFIKSS